MIKRTYGAARHREVTPPAPAAPSTDHHLSHAAFSTTPEHVAPIYNHSSAHFDDEDELTPPTSLTTDPDLSLTPRSRVKKLLAAFDGNEEEEEEEDERQHSLQPYNAHADVHAQVRTLQVQEHTSVLPDFDEAAVDRDRGSTASDRSDDDDEDDGEAYARLKRSFARPPLPVSPPKPQRPRESADDTRTRLLELAAEARRAQAAQEAEASIITPRRPQNPVATANADQSTDDEDIEAELRMSSGKKGPLGRGTTARAASKKALDQMHRETERLARGMNLAPEIVVKKKLSFTDFFARVGYKTAKEPSPQPPAPESATEPQPPQTEPVPESVVKTASPISAQVATSHAFAPELEDDDEIELPTVEQVLSQPIVAPKAITPQKKAYHIIPPLARGNEVLLDSDSDNESPRMPADPVHARHAALFSKRDFAQVKEDRKAAKFISLARPDSPTKLEARDRKIRDAALKAAVAKQAQADRAAREAALRAAGVEILSTEERQRQALQVEDLVERARRQAEEIRKLEQREDRRRKAIEDGVNDEQASGDEADDESWRGDDSDNDEDIASGEENDDDDMNDAPIDNDNDGEEEDEEDDENDENTTRADQASPVPQRTRLGRTTSILSERALSDDEEKQLARDRDLEAESEQLILQGNRRRRPRARFLLADDDDEDDEHGEGDKENAIPLVRHVSSGSLNLRQMMPPEAGISTLPAATSVNASTANDVPLGQLLSPQSLIRVRDDSVATQFDPLSPGLPLSAYAPMPTQYTQATQIDPDNMLEESEETARSPTPELQPPADDLETRPLNRLRKATAATAAITAASALEPPKPQSRKWRQERDERDAAEIARAREALVDDRAVESDDEYAGLGGASDSEDDAGADATQLAELRAMIDEADEVDGDDDATRERVRALIARAELDKDEKLVAELLKDLESGGLRRRRGTAAAAGLLDDDNSDDEEDERRRYAIRKQQMRARMLESQNLTLLADNPRTAAFVAAMDDVQDKPIAFIDIDDDEDDQQLQQPNQPEASMEDTQQDDDTLNLEFPDLEPTLPREDTQVDDEDVQVPSSLPLLHHQDSSGTATTIDASFKRPRLPATSKPNKLDSREQIRKALSFLNDNDELSSSRSIIPDSQDDDPLDDNDLDVAPPPLRRRSTLAIDDRSIPTVPSLVRRASSTAGSQDSLGLSRESSFSRDSLYGQLGRARQLLATNTVGEVVVQRGAKHLASRMASSAVNYHANQARLRHRSTTSKKPKKPTNNDNDDQPTSTNNTKRRHQVLQLFA
ncbi:hypothetical protein PYCC9005_004494 [Savitreella phatthalungensis]